MTTGDWWRVCRPVTDGARHAMLPAGSVRAAAAGSSCVAVAATHLLHPGPARCGRRALLLVIPRPSCCGRRRAAEPVAVSVSRETPETRLLPVGVRRTLHSGVAAMFA